MCKWLRENLGYYFSALIVLTMNMIPATPLSADYNKSDEGCCEPCDKNKTWVYLSAIALGTAAGAGTAALTSNRRGHHHESSSSSSSVDDTRDVGQSLVFSLTLDVISPELQAVTANTANPSIIVYLTQPDGTVLTQVPTIPSSPNFILEVIFPTIKNPEFGNYTVEIQSNNTSFTLNSTNLNGAFASMQSSRSGTTINVPLTGLETTTTPFSLNAASQAWADFVYGKPGVP
jgi:hypothetical protein